MTIEPPVALNKSTARSVEKMCPEGVAACPTFQLNMCTQVQQTGFSPGPETPDQYMPDPGFAVSSPSMYEQDAVSDMQKSLLSPCSNKTGLSDKMTSSALRNLIQRAPESADDCHLHGEDFEQSFNLEPLVNEAGLPVKLEPTWGPSLPIDTGQKFKAEDVMTSNNINQGPTLAQLNVIDDPFEDIDSIIRNDPINKPVNNVCSGNDNKGGTMKIPHSPISQSLATQEQQQPKTTTTYSRLRNPGPAVTMDTSAAAPRLSLTINVPTKVDRQTSCTITSPAQEVPSQMSSSPPFRNVKTDQKQKPVFNYLFAPTQIPPAMIVPPVVQSSPSPTSRSSTGYPVFSVGQQLFLPTLSTVDQSSLQQLLQQTTTAAAAVKTEPTSPTTSHHTELTRPELHPPPTPEPPQSSTTTTGLLGKTTATTPGVKREEAITGRPRPNSPGGGAGSDSNTSSNSFNQKWEEIKRYLETEEENKVGGSSTEPPVKKQKLQKDAAYHPMEEDLACDQDFNSDSDSDVDMDLSDTDSVGHSAFFEELLVGGKKEKRYFWQYNTQSKGPKGKRLCRSVDTIDPHILNLFEDPVFDPDVNDAKYKHTGRARKGDGNDITPSPYKLYQIGNQLNRLNRKINEMAPPGDLPVTTRNKTRREKNKFASRACRLKKKAQHEANKIKLFGLDTEHAQLMSVLEKMKDDLVRRVIHGAFSKEDMTVKLDKLMQTHLTAMIAGNTADYVNSVLERVIAGDRTGGITVNKSRQ